MTERILAATDLSKGSDESLRQAYATASSTGAKLAVCHVLPNLLTVNTLFPQKTQALVTEATALQHKVREALSEQIARCIPKADVEILFEQGREYAGIVKCAEAWKADLVVIGSYGSGGLVGHLGSVAEQVTRYASCNVLIARPVAARGPVLVATDLSLAIPVIVKAAAIAQKRGAPLVAVHAIDFASVAVSIEEIALDFMKRDTQWNLDHELRDLALAQLHDALAKAGVEATTHVAHGSAAAAIVNYADEIGAELIVVGSRGRTGLVRLALGSVAERVARTATRPVLTVRLHA